MQVVHVEYEVRAWNSRAGAGHNNDDVLDRPMARDGDSVGGPTVAWEDNIDVSDRLGGRELWSITLDPGYWGMWSRLRRWQP